MVVLVQRRTPDWVSKELEGSMLDNMGVDLKGDVSDLQGEGVEGLWWPWQGM